MADITLGGTPCQTSGELPAVGAAAPDTTLTTNGLADAALSSFEGVRVLNIFPSINTKICAMSVRKFNESVASHDGVTLLNVSADLPFAVNGWCATEGLEGVHHLSTFRDKGAFAEAYGVGIVDGKFAGLLARSVVVLDADGKVLHAELVGEVGHEPNYEAALAALS